MFYRDLAKAAFDIDPSAMMIAVTKQAMSFAMPGTGIPGFTRHAVRIAREGIYGLSQFLGDVLEPVTAWWDLDHLAGLSAEAERAREEMAKLTATLHEQVEKVAERLALGRSALA
jgi:acyl-[acyl-carrier-protein] desaturase